MQDYEELQKKLMIPVIISLMAAVARFAFSQQKSFLSFLRGVAIAAFVGLTTALGIHDTALSEATKGAIIGVTAFCADEVAMFLIASAGELRKDPLGYAARIFDALRGGRSK